MNGKTAMLEVNELPMLMSVQQAAATGAGCERMIRQMCEDGTLKAVKLGRVWRINRDAFLKYFGLV